MAAEGAVDARPVRSDGDSKPILPIGCTDWPTTVVDYERVPESRPEGDRLNRSRVTLRDVADQLGVSAATVSLAMRDSKKISRTTRERVKATLEASGYVYQRGAAGLRTSTTHTVGIIVNDVSDPFTTKLLGSLEKALGNAGNTPFFCNSGESTQRQTDFIHKMSEYNADGIIVCPARGSDPKTFPKGPSIPPIVCVSRTIPDVPIDSVVVDDREAGLLATRRLTVLGHRRIAFVGGDRRMHACRERLRGYRQALTDASIKPDSTLVRCCSRTLTPGHRAAEWIANLSPMPTGAICRNAAVALGLSTGLQRESLMPGRDIALIGHEDVEAASFVNPQLTVTTGSHHEMATRAVSALLERIERPHAPPRRIVLAPELIVRESCGGPVGNRADL